MLVVEIGIFPQTTCDFFGLSSFFIAALSVMFYVYAELDSSILLFVNFCVSMLNWQCGGCVGFLQRFDSVSMFIIVSCLLYFKYDRMLLGFWMSSSCLFVLARYYAGEKAWKLHLFVQGLCRLLQLCLCYLSIENEHLSCLVLCVLVYVVFLDISLRRVHGHQKNAKST